MNSRITQNRGVRALATLFTGGALVLTLGLGSGVPPALASHTSGPNQICNPSPRPDIAITDDFAYEHEHGWLKVTLSNSACYYVRVDYRTYDWTAHAGPDYVFEQGTLTFSPGQTSKWVAIDIVDDNLYENNEHLYVRLSNASGADIADSIGWVTISGLEPAT